MLKARWTRKEENVTRKGDERNTCKVLVGKFERNTCKVLVGKYERKRPHKNLGVDENNEYVHHLKT
jgi:hypothetical protein